MSKHSKILLPSHNNYQFVEHHITPDVRNCTRARHNGIRFTANLGQFADSRSPVRQNGDSACRRTHRLRVNRQQDASQWRTRKRLGSRNSKRKQGCCRAVSRTTLPPQRLARTAASPRYGIRNPAPRRQRRFALRSRAGIAARLISPSAPYPRSPPRPTPPASQRGTEAAPRRLKAQ